VADLNGDGNEDLVIANATANRQTDVGADSISVLINDTP